MTLFNAGMISLMLGYMLSQFYRAFLAVLSPVLIAELGVTPGDLAWSSGLWFIAFAAIQPVIGWGLDSFGPRRTVGLLLGLGGGGGAAAFALAQGPGALHLAMILIGIGCAPVLMGAYYIFARSYPPAAFATLAGVALGLGNLGNILSSVPLVWLVQALGWRESLWLLAALTVVAAAAILIWLRDPPKAKGATANGSLSEVIAIRPLWPILPLLFCGYATIAALRGLWAGPYLDQIFAAPPERIGQATLAMGLAIAIGAFASGPLVRLLGGPGRGILLTNAATALCLATLASAPDRAEVLAITLLTLCGLFGSSYAMFMDIGRRLLPPHLVGRGVTFLNMFSIGGAGVLQFASRSVFEHAAASGDLPHAYRMLFLFFLVPLVLGLVIFLFRKQDTPHG
ncbi:MFS transporter [Paracoccus sp. (in: a-proteobacteria)]|uniref:MFS transporter n=1 Tax=Paracoccus sp. TaxID=267 RepID=UPI0034CF959E